MAKPILVVKYPKSMSIENCRKSSNAILKNKLFMTEYHVLTIGNCSVDDVSIEVFNVNKVGSISLNKFKKQILDSIK
jgi:hypothetical protein